MTEVGLEDDNTTNRAAWRNKILSYTGEPQMTGQAMDREENNIDIKIHVIINISKCDYNHMRQSIHTNPF